MTLTELIGPLKGKVAVACFASNVARMDSDHPRRRGQRPRASAWSAARCIRMAAAATSVGLLEDVAPFVTDAEAGYFPADKILYLCTGSQGEPRAALSRIADGTHPHVKLGQGDSCVFSSRIIPGNEIPIRNLQNKLADRGVRLYTERDHPGIHVSGHPCRDELKRDVPVGAAADRRADPRRAPPPAGARGLARDLQVAEAIAPRNGDMVRLAPGRAEIIDEVPAGRLYVDGGMVDARRTARPCASAATRPSTACSPSPSRSTASGRIVSGPQVRALGLPGDADYPLEEALDDLADEAEDGAEAALRPTTATTTTRSRQALSRARQEGRLPHLGAPAGRRDDGAAGLAPAEAGSCAAAARRSARKPLTRPKATPSLDLSPLRGARDTKNRGLADCPP